MDLTKAAADLTRAAADYKSAFEVLQYLCMILVAFATVVLGIASKHEGKLRDAGEQKLRDQIEQLGRGQGEATQANVRLLGETTAIRELLAGQYPGVPLREAVERLAANNKALEARAASLEKKVQPRTLAGDPFERMRSALQASADASLTVSVQSADGDAEAFALHRRILDALMASGWTVERMITRVVATKPIIGISVEYGGKERHPAVVGLIEALRDGGLDVIEDHRGGEPLRQIRIMVGHKPN